MSNQTMTAEVPERTDRYLLIDARLRARVGVGLDEWYDAQRKLGLKYRPIAKRLTALTEIPISHEAVRQWFPLPEDEAHGDPDEAARSA